MRVGLALWPLLAFSLAACGEAVAGPYKAPRNAVGQPDLQGIWTSNSRTRLERPDDYPSVVISEAQARAIPPPQLIPPDAVGSYESEIASYEAGASLARVRGELRTAFVVDPADGRLPFTAEGRARAARVANSDDPERRTSQERCLLLPGAGPPLTPTFYNNAVQIVQTRDHLVMSLEQNHDVRIVPIRRRGHAPVARWMGDSVGWWEGQDFVIQTTSFAPAQAWRSSPLIHLYLSPQAVVTERLRRVSPTELLYSFTVVDSANYRQPWRGEMPLVATKAPMYEYACHEGNYSLPNILAGARAEERAAGQAAAR